MDRVGRENVRVAVGIYRYYYRGMGIAMVIHM